MVFVYHVTECVEHPMLVFMLDIVLDNSPHGKWGIVIV